jgi:hypothetical protein
MKAKEIFLEMIDQEKINKILEREKSLKKRMADVRGKIELAGGHDSSRDIKMNAEEELEDIKKALTDTQEKLRIARSGK